MASTPKVTGKPRFTAHGPGPYTRVVYAAVAAGQVCTPGTAGNVGKVGPATLNSKVAGVATTPALPSGAANTGTSLSGYPVLDVSMPDNETALARHGAFYLAVVTTGFADGDFVKAGVNGGVQFWDPAADQAVCKVGQCVDPAGGTVGSPSLIELGIG